MRRNFTSIGVEPLRSLLSLPKRKVYETTFSRGFNPQRDEDIADLAMLLQQYEKGLKGDELMPWNDIINEWYKFVVSVACV